MKVLFVCMANICRSPVLESALRHLAKETLLVDSCGLGWFHLGEHPDPRAFEAAKKRGILVDTRAKQFQESFLDEYDLILAVDSDVLEQLKWHAKTDVEKAKIRLATDYSTKYKGKPIGDPYYMGKDGFDTMVDMALDVADGIFRSLKRQ